RRVLFRSVRAIGGAGHASEPQRLETVMDQAAGKFRCKTHSPVFGTQPEQYLQLLRLAEIPVSTETDQALATAPLHRPQAGGFLAVKAGTALKDGGGFFAREAAIVPEVTADLGIRLQRVQVVEVFRGERPEAQALGFHGGLPSDRRGEHINKPRRRRSGQCRRLRTSSMRARRWRALRCISIRFWRCCNWAGCSSISLSSGCCSSSRMFSSRSRSSSRSFCSSCLSPSCISNLPDRLSALACQLWLRDSHFSPSAGSNAATQSSAFAGVSATANRPRCSARMNFSSTARATSSSSGS